MIVCPGLLVGVGLEGRVLLGQAQQRQHHLLLAGFGLGLDGDLDHRLRELHLLQDDLVLVVAEGVAGGRVLEAYDAADVAGVDLVDLLALVRVHLQQAAEALTLALGGVQHVGAGTDLAGVYAHEGQLADEGVGHDLEGQRGEGGVVARLAGDLRLCVRIDALDRRDIHRGRHVVHHGVQKELYALVAVACAAEHAEEGALDGAFADRGLDLRFGRLFLRHEFLHDGVVDVGQRFDQFRTIELRVLEHIRRNLFVAVILAHVVIVNLGAHAHEIHDAAEVVLRADGDLQGMRVRVQAVVHLLHDVEEVGAHDVHLVDVGDARNLVVFRLTPDRLGLGLDAALGSKDGNGAVQHAQGTLHLDREVDVAGGVDDVDAVAFPVAGGRSTRDGDAALLFLRHPVHGGSALVHLADLVGLAGVVEDTLRGGGLAGIDVRHDADVADHVQCMGSGHEFSPFSPKCCGQSCPAGGAPGETGQRRARAVILRRSIIYLTSITSDSAQKPCWTRPCGASLPCGGQRRPYCCWRR